MQYTISMTSRMLAIASLCVFLLCVLLFLLGIELGKRFAEPAYAPATSSAPATTNPLPSAATSMLPAAPAVPPVPAPTMPSVPAPALKP